MQAQGFENNTIEVIQVLEFLVQNIIRGANVLSYFLTQSRNMLRVAGKLVKYVGKCYGGCITVEIGVSVIRLKGNRCLDSESDLPATTMS